MAEESQQEETKQKLTKKNQRKLKRIKSWLNIIVKGEKNRAKRRVK